MCLLYVGCLDWLPVGVYCTGLCNVQETKEEIRRRPVLPAPALDLVKPRVPGASIHPETRLKGRQAELVARAKLVKELPDLVRLLCWHDWM